MVYENDTVAQIQIIPTINNNGPTTSYIVIVKNMNSVQAFDLEYLIKYDIANRDGISYYITAELNPTVCTYTCIKVPK